jgi:hypothetical protein
MAGRESGAGNPLLADFIIVAKKLKQLGLLPVVQTMIVSFQSKSTTP